MSRLTTDPNDTPNEGSFYRWQYWKTGHNHECFQILIKPEHLLHFMEFLNQKEQEQEWLNIEVIVVFNETVNYCCEYEKGLIGLSIDPAIENKNTAKPGKYIPGMSEWAKGVDKILEQFRELWR